MKIAIVGAGVSGLAAAARLHGRHELTVFEAGDHAGGHAWTLDVADAPWMAPPGAAARAPRGPFPVDVGFMVWNHATYPRLRALFDELGVETAPTSMGFSVSDPATGFEYAGETLDTLFADRRNLVRPAFLRMIRDILHFNAHAVAWVEGPHAGSTLGELVERERLSALFRDRYLVPMGAAIWSASGSDMLAFPAAFFVRFFRNHGLLEPPARQPRWRVVSGGSRRYVERLTRPFAGRIRLATSVRRVRRVADGAEVAWDGGSERFDEVVLAVHADQALALLADASPAERRVLGAFPYRSNRCVLHTDTGMLPRRRRAWASWNHRVTADPDAPVVVTYDLSRLQHLATPSPLLLSLNEAGEVAAGRVIARFDLAHPVFTRESLPAQALHAEVSGRQHVHFCGAYWRNGFHEDGLVSGERVAAALLGEAGA